MQKFSSLIENSKREIRYWWLVAVIGVMLFAAGILTFVYPAQSYLSISLLFGWVMLLAGILEIVVATGNNHYITRRGWVMVGGIIEAVLGIILIFNVGLSAAVLPVFLGFWLLLRAFSTIGLSGDMKMLGIAGSGWTLTGGILLMICALWILFQPLVFGTWAVIAWVGTGLLLAGISTGSLAAQMHQAHRWIKQTEA